MISIHGVQGRLLREPVWRDTRRKDYAIKAITILKEGGIPAGYWQRFWSLAETKARRD